MSVGLLIISHDGIGPAILGTTKHMFTNCPLNVKLLTASRDCDPDELMVSAAEQIEVLDQGSGVLVLTDLYGSTPSNIAKKLLNDKNIRIVTGLNMSMLIRLFNYPEGDLDGLAEKALSGGKGGILLVDNQET